MNVIDAKPKNEVVLDYKPKVETTLDFKPRVTADGALAYQSYSSVIQKGEPMGLLLALTYPSQLSFTTNIHF